MDRPYGEVSRFHIGDVNLPANGGMGNLGIFRTITWGEMKDGQRTPLAGETWVAMVEFSKPLKAMGVMSYGDSSQPGIEAQQRSAEIRRGAQAAHLVGQAPDVEKHVEDRTQY